MKSAQGEKNLLTITMVFITGYVSRSSLLDRKREYFTDTFVFYQSLLSTLEKEI